MNERSRLIEYDDASRIIQLRFRSLLKGLRKISTLGQTLLLERGKDGVLVPPGNGDGFYTEVYFVGTIRHTILLLEGVITLLERGLTHPARIVTRSLFELLVAATYMEKESAGPLARQLLYSSLRDQEVSDTEALRALRDGGADREVVATMEKQLNRIKDDIAKVSSPTLDERSAMKWSGRSFRDMSKQVGLEMEYLAHYKDLSWDAHGTLAVFHITERLKNGDLVMRDMFDLRDTRMIATLAGNWALGICEVVTKRWGSDVRAVERLGERLHIEVASVVWPGSPLTEPRLPSSGALVLGLDVGFSTRNETCCAYLLNVNPLTNTIELSGPAERFALPNATASLNRLVAQGGLPMIVSVDAPLTPHRLPTCPPSGRLVDKWFAKGRFSATKSGLHATSIAVPKQGWPLYCAGMDLVTVLGTIDPTLKYVPFDDLTSLSVRGIVEGIPKLFHGLLVDPVTMRKGKGKKQIDDFLFPMLFTGELRSRLDDLLGSVRFDAALEGEIKRLAAHPSRFHEEIGGLVTAIQGVLFVLGRYSAIGCVGEHEGYFLLPPVALWHDEWAEATRELSEPNSTVRLLSSFG
jgi:hypothetical protein